MASLRKLAWTFLPVFSLASCASFSVAPDLVSNLAFCDQLRDKASEERTSMESATLCSYSGRYPVHAKGKWSVTYDPVGDPYFYNFLTPENEPEDANVPLVWYDFVPSADIEYALQMIQHGMLDQPLGFQRTDKFTIAHAPSDRGRSVYLSSWKDYRREVLQVTESGGGVLLVKHLFFDLPVNLVEGLASTGEVTTKLLEDAAFRESIARSSQTEQRPPLKEVPPIPKTLAEAFEVLNHMLKPDEIEAFRKGGKSAPNRAHHGLGTWIRNNWGLWGDSELSQYFRKMGITEADDMSGIILTSYQRYLNKQPLEIAKQLDRYKQWWANMKKVQ